MLLEQEMDKTVRKQIAQILKSNAPKDVKYALLDKLQIGVMEHHPDGWAADVIGDIQAATDEVLYPTNGGDAKNK